MWRCMAGGLIFDYEFGILLLLLSYMLYIDVYESCLASCHCLGRGQISVKPTGHGRFFVENYQTYFEIISYFKKEINWIKGGLFHLFIALL